MMQPWISDERIEANDTACFFPDLDELAIKKLFEMRQ
jgi:hypothetical protein